MTVSFITSTLSPKKLQPPAISSIKIAQIQILILKHITFIRCQRLLQIAKELFQIMARRTSHSVWLKPWNSGLVTKTAVTGKQMPNPWILLQ